MKNKKYISYLIVKSILEDLDLSELHEFNKWRAKPANELLYNNLLNQQDFKDVFDNYNYLKSRKHILKNNIKRKLLLRNIYNYSKYAAILLILIGSFFYLNYIGIDIRRLFQNNEQYSQNVELEAPMLKLSNGMNVLLDKNMINVDSNILINIPERQIKYNTYQYTDKHFTIEIDTLVTPKLCDYQIVLEDGSIVHLNSMSRLIFPKAFAPDKARTVEIKGEAYFEVAKDGRAFIVKSKDQTIKVLGTKFNVNTYNNNSITTLVEGSVSISINTDGLNESSNIILKPGEQSIVNQSRISTREVDISDEIAWTRGEFIFRKHRLEEILNTLSRWYDYEVSYEKEEIKDYIFSIKVKKMKNPEKFFDLLEEASDLEFDFKNKKLYVK